MKGWKKIYWANGLWKEAQVAIIISGKVDFKLTLIKWDKEGLSILIHTNKKGITPKRNNNYQTICTQHQCTQFYHTYSEGPKNIYRLQHSGSGRL
jgi:hypothetical protein